MRFDLIEFRPDESDLEYPVLDIFINGRDLIDLVREVELPFATAEGAPGIAGAYMGLPPADVLPPSAHFLAEAAGLYGHGESAALYLCNGCQIPGCWDLFTHIERLPDSVLWRDFSQGHRLPGGRSAFWDYRGFGPFRFDRTQYEAALDKAAMTLKKGK